MKILGLLENRFSIIKQRGLIYRVPCIYHDERQPSMDINLDEDSKYYGSCVCWGCGKTVSLKRYFRDMGWDVDLLPENLKKKIFFLEQKPKVTKKNLKLNPLPANFKLFFFDDSTKIAETKALKYLYARGFDDETIKNNFLGYVGIDGSKYENSIIIPFFNEKYEIAYFISRKFNKSSSIRYVNLETADGFYSRNDVIFNQFGFDTAETLILCEGAFNAMTYNMILQDTKVQAVATNGTKVSGAIIDRILHRAGLHRIIFAFDYKTDAVVRDIYSRLLGKCEFEIILFEDIKDVNDLLILGGGGAVKKKFESRKKYQPNYFI